MTPQFFYLRSLKCPKCNVVQLYYDKPDIVCDYCVADIKIGGKLQ